MNYHLIQNQSDLPAAIEYLRQMSPLAVDMEMENNFHHYGLHLALIQIAAPTNAVFIFDPLSLADLKPVGALLTGGQQELIIHNADFDRRTCFQLYGWILGKTFDTQIAATFCGLKKPGLANLLHELFEVKIDKRFQKHDWLRRPLTKAALEYAVRDVNLLHPARDLLTARLIELGRLEWVKEEFARAERVITTDCQIPAYCRIKHSASLSSRQFSVLKTLAEYRDAVARELDLPPQFVIRDALLLDLACRPPADEKTLKTMRGLHPALYHKKGAEGLLKAMLSGMSGPEQIHPVWRHKHPRHPPAPGWDRRLKEMRQWRIGIARELDLEPHLVLDAEALEWYARNPEQEMPAYLAEKVRHWQKQIIWPDFLQRFGCPPNLRA